MHVFPNPKSKNPPFKGGFLSGQDGTIVP